MSMTSSQASSKDWRAQVSSLSRDQRAAILSSLTPTLPSRYVPHDPTPIQRAFLLLGDREVFFGGAVGGGKSDALLMAALQYVDVPGYAAILFRRTFQDLALPGALIPRSHEWLANTDASWDGIGHQWRFPTGSFLQFGYIQHAGDEHRYRSAEFQFEGFDEATQFPTESQVRYVMHRLRRPSTGPLSKVPLRARLASNPGGLGHEWVNARYVNPKTRAKGVRFLPSWLADNPHLDREEYLATLHEVLDDVSIAQLVGGDWTVRPVGGRFDRRWLKNVHAALPAGAEDWRWVRSIDLAATEAKEGKDPDYTVATLVGLDDERRVWVADVQRFRESPGTTEERLKAIAIADRLRFPNVRVIMEQEPGAAGKTVVAHYEKVLWGIPFVAQPSTGKKEVRAIPWAVSWQRDGGPNIIPGEWLADWLDEHEAFPTGAHDDQVDSAGGGYNFLVAEQFEPGGQTIIGRQDSTHHLSSAYHARRGAPIRRR